MMTRIILLRCICGLFWWLKQKFGSVCLFECVSVCLSACLPACLRACLCLSSSLSTCLCLCLSVCLSLHASISVPFLNSASPSLPHYPFLSLPLSRYPSLSCPCNGINVYVLSFLISFDLSFLFSLVHLFSLSPRPAISSVPHEFFIVICSVYFLLFLLLSLRWRKWAVRWL